MNAKHKKKLFWDMEKGMDWKQFLAMLVICLMLYAMLPVVKMSFDWLARTTENNLSVKSYQNTFEASAENNEELGINQERYDAVLAEVAATYDDYTTNKTIQSSFMEIDPAFRYSPGLAETWIRAWFLVETNDGKQEVWRVAVAKDLADSLYKYMVGENNERAEIGGIIMNNWEYTPTLVSK